MYERVPLRYPGRVATLEGLYATLGLQVGRQGSVAATCREISNSIRASWTGRPRPPPPFALKSGQTVG